VNLHLVGVGPKTDVENGNILGESAKFLPHASLPLTPRPTCTCLNATMAVSSYTLALTGAGKKRSQFKIQPTHCHFPSHIVHVSSHPPHSNHPVLAPSAGNVCLPIPTHTNRSPHAAIREDVTGNLTALEELTAQVTPPPELLFCESGGDNLAANFSRELADYTIYVIDVAGGDKVPRKGGPGITQSDLLVRGCRCWSVRTTHVLQCHNRVR
jgi:hypothetical protein